MPRTNTKIYTQKEFENDLNQLESLVKSKNNKNKNNKSKNNNQYGSGNGNNKEEEEEYENEEEEYENEEEEYENEEEEYENEEEENQYGGKEYDGEYRRFKVVSLDGKPVKFEGRAEIREHHTPITAAKKLLRSIAAEKNLTGSNKLKLGSVIYTIKETTRGSKLKVYGPYSGKYRKYSPEEIKKIKKGMEGAKAGASRKYEMKAEVKLHKKKENKESLKGGSQL